VDIDAVREYCLGKPGKVKEDMPFGEDTLVFKVQGKIFLLLSMMARPLTINLKCDPERAVEIRERYDSVQPGYHMNKKHWNTVILDGKVPTKEVLAMIDHSYELVADARKESKTKRLSRRRKKS
jgi:predicted DNA-binding protein (MmcQ/YjbR family)